jgi:UDP-GlcNAc3NAcA epimerase
MSQNIPLKSFQVLTVVGARPQFVKAAALSPCLQATGIIEESIVHTGQHFDHAMSDVFFEEMGIPSPTVNLGIGGGTHGQNTGRMIEALEKVMMKKRPDAVLIYGDTDSTLATAIAASKLGLCLVHIEAGLRSFRRAMPEEINRVLTDHVSDILYAPSRHAVELLAKEGIKDTKVVNAGDVMFDVVKRFSAVAMERSSILKRLGLHPLQYQVLTLHRKENVDDRMTLMRVLDAVGAGALPTVFLVHPRTAKMLSEFRLVVPKNIRLIEPVGYLDMLRLVQDCKVVLTDSGGLQKEAYFVGRPCITLRDETEWIELVEIGVNRLTGTDPGRITKAIAEMVEFGEMPEGVYGDGNAAKWIAQDLAARLMAGA